VLAGALLGPGAAAIVITCVLMVQSLLFSDGGVLALGANIFNMSFIGAVGGYAIYRPVQRLLPGLRGRITAVFFAAWCSTVLASLTCAGELALSGTLAPHVVFPAMVSVHTLIGIGEGLITSLVILAIARVRPELLDPEHHVGARAAGLEFVLFGLVISLGLATFLSPYACSWPDGLDKVAARLGFQGRAATLVKTLIPDYKMPGIRSEGIATAIAGTVGTAIMFGLAYVVGRVLVRDKPAGPGPNATPR
jgi:cobalt/nickel transport system permease protein